MFDPGTELEADVVIFATGFHSNMRNTIADIVGPTITDRIDNFWGLDEEGEVRGAWRPVGR